MSKEEQVIDDSTEVTDTDTTNDPPIAEQNGDTEIGQETSTEQSDGDSPTDENRNDSQTTPELGETATAEPPRAGESDSEYKSILTSVNQHLSNLQELFTGQIARNQNQKQMFDSVYREMKDYKDNTLMEAFHKPIIHNLIQFYDNFVEVESQLESISRTIESFGFLFDDGSAKQLRKLRPKEQAEKLPQVWTELKENLSNFHNNLENVRIELEEVLYRIDVEPYEERPKKLDRKLHKTVETMQTDNPDQNENVAKVHKIGFNWRDKVFRPEEVTIFRYTPPADEPKETVSEKPADEKGDKTNG